MLKNALLAIASVVVFLGALEFGARALGVGNAQPVADYMADWERQWDGDFYTLGEKPNVNREGLRDIEHEEVRAAGVTRIAFLGDSVTFGHKLPAEASFPAFVRRELEQRGEPSDVMNVALPGWSTRQQRIAYERIVRRYRPDHVVLGFCLNDVAETQNNLARPPGWLVALYRTSNLVRALVGAQAWEIGRVEDLFFAADEPRVASAWERTTKELDALADAVAADDARFTLLVLPFRFQLDPGAPPPTPQNRLRAWAQQRGVGFVDALPALQPVGRASFIDYDHLSPEGAHRVAQFLILSGAISRAESR